MISVIIPLVDEAPCLRQLHRELAQVADEHGYEMQMIFVDDGSTDESWQVICELADADYRVEGIRFRRNFGKAAALSAGFQAASGELLVTIDADLQDDPHEIPRLLGKLDEGFDVVSGLEKSTPRSLAQNMAFEGLQLAGRLADRRETARPQLRAKNVSAAR